MFPEYTLKESHNSTKNNFMWRYDVFHPIIKYPGRIGTIVKKLKFFIGTIVIGMVATRVSWIQGKWLDILVLQVMKGVATEAAFILIKEMDFIVNMGGSTDRGEFGHFFNP